jgi:hypothetical protein
MRVSKNRTHGDGGMFFGALDRKKIMTERWLVQLALLARSTLQHMKMKKKKYQKAEL